MDRTRDGRGSVLTTQGYAQRASGRRRDAGLPPAVRARAALRSIEVFQPESPRQPARKVWILFLLGGTLLVLLRVLSSGASVNSLWAEDGSVFLQQALADGAAATTDTYAGYLHLLPRAIALVGSAVPLAWSAAALTVLAAATLSVIALLAAYAVSGHVQSPFLRLVLCLFVVLNPAGPETVGSIANLHWSLVFLAVCVLLWDPRTVGGSAVSCGVLLLAALSNPMGLLLLPLALLRVAVLGRRALPQLVVLSTGVGLQGIAMATAGERGAALLSHPARIGVWYVGDVLPTAVFGSGIAQREAAGVSWVSVALGVLVLLVMLLAARALPLRGSRRTSQAVLACLCCSALLYGALTALAGIAPGRYSVPAVLLLLLAGLITLDLLLAGRTPFQAWRAGGAARAGLCVLALSATGTAASLPALSDRAQPSWRDQVTAAEDRCHTAGVTGAELQIPPDESWTLVLPCKQIR